MGSLQLLFLFVFLMLLVVVCAHVIRHGILAFLFIFCLIVAISQPVILWGSFNCSYHFLLILFIYICLFYLFCSGRWITKLILQSDHCFCIALITIFLFPWIIIFVILTRYLSCHYFNFVIFALLFNFTIFA